MHKLVPTKDEKSKKISKGSGYETKLQRRKQVIYQQHNTKFSGRTQGNNNLSAKNINEKKYLTSVVGMAMTKAEKKKLLKK